MLATENAYITVEDAAVLLKLHKDTVRRFVRERRLPGKKIGHVWRISRAGLDRFMESDEEQNEGE